MVPGSEGTSATLLELLEADVTFERPTADDDMARELGVDSKASCHPWPYKEVSPDDLLTSIRKDMRQVGERRRKQTMCVQIAGRCSFENSRDLGAIERVCCCPQENV